MRDVGKNIRDLRISRNLTQEELADKLFVTRQTVSNYETGKSRPDVDMILRIAEILDTDANTVFYGIPTPPDRRKAYRRLILCAGILAILFVAYQITIPIAEELQQKYFRVGLQYLLLLYIRPIMLLLFGWGLLQGLSVILQFKELNGNWVKICKWVLLGTTILLLTSTLPWMIFIGYGDYLAATTNSVMLSSPDIPVFNEIGLFTMMIDMKAPAMYLLIGGALRLFCFLK